jgi:hypothetical protein
VFFVLLPLISEGRVFCRNGRHWVLGASVLVLLAGPANAAYISVWQAGLDNNTQSEFGQEGGTSNAAPGSATVKDDDWYFAGTYPSPIGTLASDEVSTNFERALTLSDPTDRIHFNLTSAQIGDDFQYRLVIDTVSNNTSVTTSPIPFTAAVNGVQIFSGQVNQTSQTFTSSPLLGSDFTPTTGDNVVTLNRSNTGAGWMQFDYVRLEVQVPEPSMIGGMVLIGGVGLLRRRRTVQGGAAHCGTLPAQ